jgi:superfamily II DNA/RNA helicase
MEKEERDKVMHKFRKQEIQVLITTDLIARGIDIP